MFSSEKLLKRITKIKDENKNILEKNLNKDMLIFFHKVVEDICKDSNIIIKGGRSLNINTGGKIYSDEDIFTLIMICIVIMQ